MSLSKDILYLIESIKLCEGVSEVESGLEVKRKKKVVGKLVGEDPSDLGVQSIEKLLPGDSLKICDNCGRGIKHICYLTGGFEVGPDCALTLGNMGDEDQQKVKDYVKKATNVANFNRSSSKKLIGASFEQPNELFTALSALEKSKASPTLKMLLSRLGQHIMKNKPLSYKPEVRASVNNYILNLIYKELLDKKKDEFEAYIASLHGEKDTRKKNFWFDVGINQSIFWNRWFFDHDMLKGIGEKPYTGRELVADVLV